MIENDNDVYDVYNDDDGDAADDDDNNDDETIMMICIYIHFLFFVFLTRIFVMINSFLRVRLTTKIVCSCDCLLSHYLWQIVSSLKM